MNLWFWLSLVLLLYIVLEKFYISKVISRLKNTYNIPFPTIKRIVSYLNPIFIFREFFRIIRLKTMRELNASQKSVKISEDLSILHNLTKKLIGIKDIVALYKTIVKTFMITTGAEKGSLAIYDPATDSFVLKYGENINIENLDALTFKRGEGLIWKCVQEGHSLFIRNIKNEPEYKRLSFESSPPDEAVILVPLKIGEETLAVVSLSINSELADNLHFDPVMLDSFAGICAAYIKNFQLINELVKNRILQQQIEASKKIQEGLLFENQLKLQNYEISYKIIPALQISGDFYTIRLLPNNLLLIGIADVVGKGFSSAIMMAITKIALEIYAENIREPADLVTTVAKLNRLLFSYIGDEEKFLTLAIFLLNLDSNRLHYINCGHTSPVIYRKTADTFEWLREKAIALGFVEDIDEYLTVFETQLNAHDFLFIYSDGVIEARNKENIFLEERGLLDILFYTKNITGVQKKAKVFEQELRRYMQIEPLDDITYIFLERKNGVS